MGTFPKDVAGEGGSTLNSRKIVTMNHWRHFAFLLSFVGFSLAQFGGPAMSPEVNEDSTRIPVVYLQADGYTTIESWAAYNGTIKEDLVSFTKCSRVQIWYDRPRMYIFTYAYDDEQTNELFAEYHLGRGGLRVCKRETKYCGWHRVMPEFYQWRHICLTYDGAKDLYKVFIDGEKVESGSWAGDGPMQPVRKGGLNYIGQDQDSMGGDFNPRQSWSGLISQFNVWNWALEDYFIENAAECRSDLLGNIIKWKEERWYVGKSGVKMKNMPLFELCGSADDVEAKYFLFPVKFEYHFYTAWCKNQGGEIAAPVSDENYHELMDIAEGMVNRDIHEKCLHASGSLVVWGGITDEWEEGVWMNPYSREPSAAAFWEVGSPNGGPAENCIRTHLDRRWKDVDCVERNCALCHFPRRMNLTFRGLCGSETKKMEGFFDTIYFIYGFINLKPHWRGLGKSHIYFRPRRATWRLESFYDVKKYAEFFAEDSNPYDYWPTGRSTWNVNEGICQMSGLVPRKMTLTDCIDNDTGAHKFTCTDGTCVPMPQRCDLQDNCPDGSDEENCDILRVPSDYRQEIFPITESGDPLEVNINVTILAFPEINTLELSFISDFILLMRWADPRLEYFNLRDVDTLNSLSKEVQSKIWAPALSFPNARQAEGSVVDDGSMTLVLKRGIAKPDNIRIAEEADIFRGVDSPMVMRREYFINFNCDYDLGYYPFDTQICEMVFQVNGIPKQYLNLGVQTPAGCDTCDGATYLGNRDLVEYLIGDSMMDEMNNDSDKTGKVRVMTVFKRKWSYHFWTIFLQSVFLLSVAYMTFYFKISNFQDRIMIAITTMMVVATIQSSINKMVPKTSYLKMIDIWLMYSFNIIIFIMIVHTTMDRFIPRDPKTQIAINPKVQRKKNTDGDGEDDGEGETNDDKIDLFGDNPCWDPGWVQAYRINTAGQIGNLIVFFLFNVVFWSVSLSHFYKEFDLLASSKK